MHLLCFYFYFVVVFFPLFPVVVRNQYVISANVLSALCITLSGFDDTG